MSKVEATQIVEGMALIAGGAVTKAISKKTPGGVMMEKTGDVAMTAGGAKILNAGNKSYERLDKNGDLRNTKGSGTSNDPKHLNSPMEEETFETVFLLALSTVSMVFSLILNNAPEGSTLFTVLYAFFIISIFAILNYLYQGIFKVLAKIFLTKKDEKETSGKE